jgi:hypothetical protein
MACWTCEIRDPNDHGKVLASLRALNKSDLLIRINETLKMEGILVKVTLNHIEKLQRVGSEKHSETIEEMAKWISIKRLI